MGATGYARRFHMSRARRSNAKGRSTGSDPFVRLPHWAFDSPAYRSLKSGPRALLWEMVRRYNGRNSGRIVFGQRDMSVAIDVTDRETIAGYVRTLEDRGFIAVTRRGGFNVKIADRRASEFALTWEKVGNEPPTKDFLRWQPTKNDGTEKPADRDGKAVPKGAKAVRQRSNVSEFPSLKAEPDAVSRAEFPSTYTSIAIGSAKR